MRYFIIAYTNDAKEASKMEAQGWYKLHQYGSGVSLEWKGPAMIETNEGAMWLDRKCGNT